MIHKSPGKTIHELYVWVSPFRRYLGLSASILVSLNLEIPGLYSVNGSNNILVNYKYLDTVISAIESVGDMYRVIEEYQPRFEEKRWQDANGIIPLQED